MPRRKKVETDQPPERLSDDDARARISACYDELEAKIMVGYATERSRAELETWRGFAESYKREYPEIWAEVSAEKKRRKQHVEADSNR